ALNEPASAASCPRRLGTSSHCPFDFPGDSTRGHPSPWAGRARAEAELPHIDPRRGVLSTELGLTRVERIEWLRAKPAHGRAAQLRVWSDPSTPDRPCV